MVKPPCAGPPVRAPVNRGVTKFPDHAVQLFGNDIQRFIPYDMKITDILEKLGAGARTMLVAARMPTTILMKHPPGSPAPGAPQKLMVLERGDEGSLTYRIHQFETRGPVKTEVRAERVIDHTFQGLESLKAYLQGRTVIDSSVASCWMQSAPFETIAVIVLDDHQPENGAVGMRVERHPAWRRWNHAFGNGSEPVDLSHRALTDLLLDEQEAVQAVAGQEMLPQLAAQFRAATSLEYDADLNSGGHVGARLTFRGSHGADPTQTNVQLPREFEALIPPYSGLWIGDAQPTVRAVFRIRMVPPKNAGEAPKFRVIWANAEQYEHDAADIALAKLQLELADVISSDRVYRGVPHAKHYIGASHGDTEGPFVDSAPLADVDGERVTRRG